MLIFNKTKFLPGKIWSRTTVKALQYLCNITFEIKGSMHPHNQACIYAVRHQSAWETMIFHLISERPVYIFKRELLYLPFFNLHLIFMGMIVVNRSAGMAALKNLLEQVKLKIKENRPIIIFPEGTRTEVGVNVKVFPGIVAMYDLKLAPVIPVALNSGQCWGKNSFIKRPGKITIEFLPPLESNLSRKEFTQTLSDRLTEHSNKLN
ncbi:lysophospholipid acyltransferase family protein [Rickettsiales endosymbiont of Stachyamoeba lipophora]|uniref:lysophospholipid acyltransferase family protein n=1 Tax=Rickettsiales endosymbiont of Stachyamoeba lipophora TaxID=2486578 RepID=UPI0013DDF78A|nr:lysophospholipid acyltransferase family protein [Rickettsiales endosymbiont of Stachyamoeba lipophora]